MKEAKEDYLKAKETEERIRNTIKAHKTIDKRIDIWEKRNEKADREWLLGEEAQSLR